MHTCLVAFAFVVALAGTAHAQSVTCRDGTVLTGVNAQRMCVAHGGLPPEAYAPVTPTSRGRATSSAPGVAAAGGGPDQVGPDPTPLSPAATWRRKPAWPTFATATLSVFPSGNHIVRFSVH